MSGKVTKEQASNLLAAAKEDRNHYLQRYAQTIVDQYEQIERLQNALHKADKWGVDVLSNLYEDEFITKEDMK